MLVGHSKQWEFLKKKLEQNQLSHAYLFSGQNGIGKKTFVIEFVKYINCLASQKPRLGGAEAGQINAKIPCQKCANCLMIEKNSFPDLTVLSPNGKDEKFGDGGEIKISRIREAQNFLSYKSYYGSFKSVIIDCAESMNQEAQSCLLKTLEEPKGKTLIFLISSRPEIILPTIFSRCQQIKFFWGKNLPENLEKKEIEKEILNSLIPVLNSNLSEKFKFVKSIDAEKQKIEDIIKVAQKYLRHLLLAKIGIEKFDVKDGVFAKYSIGDLKRVLNLAEAINRELTFTNASPKLALEILLMET
ncbi:MAG: hypothetical protein AAB352_01600 [Patescibacteria group bacterium]